MGRSCSEAAGVVECGGVESVPKAVQASRRRWRRWCRCRRWRRNEAAGRSQRVGRRWGGRAGELVVAAAAWRWRPEVAEPLDGGGIGVSLLAASPSEWRRRRRCRRRRWRRRAGGKYPRCWGRGAWWMVWPAALWGGWAGACAMSWRNAEAKQKNGRTFLRVR